jgi:hypothetical protein
MPPLRKKEQARFPQPFGKLPAPFILSESKN